MACYRVKPYLPYDVTGYIVIIGYIVVYVVFILECIRGLGIESKPPPVLSQFNQHLPWYDSSTSTAHSTINCLNYYHPRQEYNINLSTP